MNAVHMLNVERITKSFCGGLILDQIPHCMEQNSCQMSRVYPGGRISGFGIDWNIMNLTSINMRKIDQCNLMLISLSVIAFLRDSMSNYFFVITFSNSTLYFACRFDELCSSGASILEVSNLTY